MANADLTNAKNNKDDEFYTQMTDIENELIHYQSHFDNKIIYCNCDNPLYSNFWKYFKNNFKKLGLKKLVATYKDTEKSFITEINKTGVMQKELSGNGDFRSPECIEILKQSDIVITNPPFSLFREYVAQLIEYNKQFLIIGNQNAITYKEIFPLLKDNRLWLGYKTGDMTFKVPNSSQPRKTRYWVDDTGQKWRSLGNICWFTNMDIPKRHELLHLSKKYSANEYPKYDNYNAININRVLDIPYDYMGIMGVPITFLSSYNPEQFTIIKFRKGEDNKDLSINGKCPYFRILIQRIS